MYYLANVKIQKKVRLDSYLLSEKFVLKSFRTKNI